MDWGLILVLAISGGIFLWQRSKNVETAKIANQRLKQDGRLYEHIKAGMREYHFRDGEQQFWRVNENRQRLFETADLIAFHVTHVIESRVGFYFKDLGEYGLYSAFAGNGDEFIESYYRTDAAFQKEGMLIPPDD
ncbi:hypothetical protein ABIB06_001865 [Bradyrhizobium sp. LB8.2]|uniref:hypothetical protein n=1 Tax=unclassified Bradyrhizobium TaxID=2631580 RepID=UPI003397BD65